MWNRTPVRRPRVFFIDEKNREANQWTGFTRDGEFGMILKIKAFCMNFSFNEEVIDCSVVTKVLSFAIEAQVVLILYYRRKPILTSLANFLLVKEEMIPQHRHAENICWSFDNMENFHNFFELMSLMSDDLKMIKFLLVELRSSWKGSFHWVNLNEEDVNE